jgi:hypothetical protein
MFCFYLFFYAGFAGVCVSVYAGIHIFLTVALICTCERFVPGSRPRCIQL